MIPSISHLSFRYIHNESLHNVEMVLKGHGSLSFWFDLSHVMKVTLSIILMVNIVVVGLVGLNLFLSDSTSKRGLSVSFLSQIRLIINLSLDFCSFKFVFKVPSVECVHSAGSGPFSLRPILDG